MLPLHVALRQQIDHPRCQHQEHEPALHLRPGTMQQLELDQPLPLPQADLPLALELALPLELLAAAIL